MNRNMSSGATLGTDTYTRWALELSGLTSNEQLVLIRLAYYADILKTCRPSVERLVGETGLSRSTIYRCLTGLEDAGILKRKATEGTSVYFLRRGLKGCPTETQGFPSLTLTPNRPTTSTSTNQLLHPSDEGPSRPRTTTTRLKRKTRVVTSEEAARVASTPAVVRGWEAVREAAARSRRRKPQKETTVAMPGFEKETAAAPKRRGVVDDSEGLLVLGKLETPEEKPKSKPVSEWRANDLQRYISRLARQKAPELREQVPVGWALGDFAKWLKQGTPAEVLRQSIDDFFADEANFLRTDSKLTIWQRWRIFFVHNQQDTIDRVEDEAQVEEQDPVEADARMQEYLRSVEERKAAVARRQAEEAAVAARKAAEEAEAERLAGIRLEALLAARGGK